MPDDLRGRPVPDLPQLAANSARALAQDVIDSAVALPRERDLAFAVRHLCAALDAMLAERGRR